MQHLDAMGRYTGKFMFSEMFNLYLDYPHSMTSLKKVYTCQPKIGKKTESWKDMTAGP